MTKGYENSKKIRDIFPCPALFCREITLGNRYSHLRDILPAAWGDSDAWVLGHALDGLIWGRIRNSVVVISHDAAPDWGAALRPETLLDLRVFNPNMELRIWWKDDDLKACIAHEKTEDEASHDFFAFDEKMILLAATRPDGDIREINGVKFSRLRGRAGQRQAVPVDWDGSGQKWRLTARHYLAPDLKYGMLRITENRLTGLNRVA